MTETALPREGHHNFPNAEELLRLEALRAQADRACLLCQQHREGGPGHRDTDH